MVSLRTISHGGGVLGEVLARETATGDLSPKGATRWDETVRNDLKMDCNYYSALLFVWVAGKYSDGHHCGE